MRVTETIGQRHTSERTNGGPRATGFESGNGTLGSVRSSSPFQISAKAALSVAARTAAPARAGIAGGGAGSLVHGVGTRNVDALAQALGLNDTSKDQVSPICKELYGQVHAFRTRAARRRLSLFHAGRHLREGAGEQPDGINGRRDRRRRSPSGEREALGTDVGPAEYHQFWLESDAHEGLKAAIAQVFAGATWQRCRVHFMRNALSTVPRAAQAMVVAALR
jgi:hypothetical protein